VVANQFIIREIDPSSPDFMVSDNLFDVARRNNLWDESKGKLDFLKTFAPPRAHSPYATRRVWRVFSLVAPGIKLNPYTDPYASDYPFSVQASRVLSHEDIIALNVRPSHFLVTDG
jgi:dipeptidase